METNDICLVVPCYNEAVRLDGQRFISDAATFGVDLLFVDDGSEDGTFALLQQLAAQAPERVRLRRLSKNRGKAEAVRQGMADIIKADYRYGGYWDADLATPLGEIPGLKAPLLDGARMALGSRVKLLGREIERRASRHYLGRVFATCASLALNLPVYDTQCGAKLFDLADKSVQSAFATPFGVNWIFDVEMIARFLVDSRQRGEGNPARLIVEVPLHRWGDVAGSKVGPAAFLGAFFDLLRIVRRYSRALYDR